jgi:hypothetical protein
MVWSRPFFVEKNGSNSQNSKEKSEIIHVFPANNCYLLLKDIF